MSEQIFSIIFITSSAFIFTIWEKFFPYNPQTKLNWNNHRLDILAYATIQPFIVAWIISQIANFFQQSSFIFNLITPWPFYLQLLFFIITHDFIMYWIHRWQHSNSLGWKLHEVHHYPQHLNWLSGVRSHPLEMFLFQTIEFLPIWLLGGSADLVLAKTLVDAFCGQWIHANISLPFKGISKIINTPHMHRWHHADDLKVYHKNFGTKFSIWDWIFKTAYYPDHKPVVLGLRKKVHLTYPKTYWKQFIRVFK